MSPSSSLRPKMVGLRLSADRSEHREKLGNSRMWAACQSTADPIEHATAGFMHRPFGKILELEPRKKGAEVPRHVQIESGDVVVGLGRCLRRHLTQPPTS